MKYMLLITIICGLSAFLLDWFTISQLHQDIISCVELRGSI